MEQGFYWVQHATKTPEIWYFADGEGGGWFQPGKSLPLHPDDLDKQGFHVISEMLEPPGS